MTKYLQGGLYLGGVDFCADNLDAIVGEFPNEFTFTDTLFGPMKIDRIHRTITRLNTGEVHKLTQYSKQHLQWEPFRL